MPDQTPPFTAQTRLLKPTHVVFCKDATRAVEVAISTQEFRLGETKGSIPIKPEVHPYQDKHSGRTFATALHAPLKAIPTQWPE